MKRGLVTDAIDRHKRLIQLRHSKFVSQRALQNVVESVRGSPIEYGVSRKMQYIARKSMCKTETPYGPLVVEHTTKLVDGEDFPFGIAPPLANMWYVTLHSPAYEACVRDTLARCPNSVSAPWRFIVYEDGVNPSDGLKNNSRNTGAWYWAILEFGPVILSHEQVWLCPLLARIDKIKKLPGGHIQLTALVLESVFNPQGIDAETSGFDLLFANGEVAHLYLKMGVVVADEPGLRELIGCKGHSGTKPCVLCQNAVLAKPPGNARSLAEFSDWAKPITETTITVACYIYVYVYNMYNDKSMRRPTPPHTRAPARQRSVR